MSDVKSCESCTMPIESGQYCGHCAEDNGDLKPFADRFENMIAWSMRQDSSLSRESAEEQTLAFMGKLPAWRNHPDYLARIGKA